METYICADCGEVTEKTRPDSEAANESKELFGKEMFEGVDYMNDERFAVICDDCFQILKIRIQ